MLSISLWIKILKEIIMEFENSELLREVSQLSFPVLQGSGKILRIKKRNKVQRWICQVLKMQNALILAI